VRPTFDSDFHYDNAYINKDTRPTERTFL
jgi:hypothetical protein